MLKLGIFFILLFPFADLFDSSFFSFKGNSSIFNWLLPPLSSVPTERLLPLRVTNYNRRVSINRDDEPNQFKNLSQM